MNSSGINFGTQFIEDSSGINFGTQVIEDTI